MAVKPLPAATVKARMIDSMDLLTLIRTKRPQTICIDGNGGAGKTRLAKALAKALDAEIIPYDFFHL